MKIRIAFLYLFPLTILLSATSFLYARQDESTTKKKKKNFEPNNAILFAPNYTAQFPFGNMRDRFGFNNLFGMQIAYKMKKNWLIALDGSFLYGTVVRENYVLDKISTSTGQFIGQNNNLVRVNLGEQGTNIQFRFGKIIPFSEKYPDAGLLFMTGFGFLQHKISINVRKTSIPQLDKTYRTGYDRMCNGPVLSQFVGGVFLARRKFYSFYGGVQFDIAFTKNARPYDFYLGEKLNEKRVDMFLGIKLGWLIPVFLKADEKEIFYY